MRQIVDKIGAILGLYSFERPEWGVGELAQALAAPKSTVSEILSSLATQGLVERTAHGRYRLGWRCFGLNEVLLQTNPLVRESRREMEELVERYGESSHLMVLDRHEAVIVERVRATVAMQILMSRVGLRLPVHSSACGKVLLAWQPWEDVIAMFGDVELKSFTPSTIRSLPQLADELQATRERGVAYDRDEMVEGLSCIAAPVFGAGGKVAAAISMSIPSYRFAEEQRAFEQRIGVAAQRITRRLSGARI